MALLKLASTMLALAVATPSKAESVGRWQPYIAEASQRFGVPAEWIERVMLAESNGQTMLNGRPIRSRVGAIGIMQLMPSTWTMLRRVLALGFNPDDPHDNILAGTLYLRMMYERFGYPGMFAAYDAGPTRLAARLSSGRALPAETVAYLRKVSGPVTVVTGIAVTSGETLFVVDQAALGEASPPLRQPSIAMLFTVQLDGR